MSDDAGIPRFRYEPDPVLANINRGAAFDRRMSIVERAAPQRSMSISQNGQKRIGIGPFSSNAAKYGIEIFDDSGFVQARLGELTTGTGGYGLEVLVPGGYYVPVASLVTGGDRQTIQGEYRREVRANSSMGWASVGPSFTVSTVTGKIDVTAGGGLSISGNKATASYSFQIVQASTGQEVVSPELRRGVYCTHDGFGMNSSQSSDRTLSFSLDPGEYRVNAVFQVFSGSGTEGNGNGAIFDRTLAVRGY